MQLTEVQKYTEYLFNAALKKCQNISDAEDLTQEVLLAALQSMAEISNIKAWLSVVLNHKYYDMLRRKYRLPTISIDFIPDESECFCAEEVENCPDSASVGREVSYLADKYRTVLFVTISMEKRFKILQTVSECRREPSCQDFQVAESKCGKDLKKWSYMKNTVISPRGWRLAATEGRDFMTSRGRW